MVQLIRKASRPWHPVVPAAIVGLSLFALGFLAPLRPGEDRAPLDHGASRFDAFAPRALHHAKPLSPRLRSLLNRAYAAARPHRATTVRRNEREIHLLHELSLECLELIDLFVRFELVRAPLIRDTTGELGVVPSIAQTLTLLRERPGTIVVFDWSDDTGVMIISPILALLGHPGVSTPDDRLSALRESIREIDVIWVAQLDTAATWEIRRAMRDTRWFRKRLRKFEAEIDPSFAELVGPRAKEYIKPHFDLFERDTELVEGLLEEAKYAGTFEGNSPRARGLYAEAERFCAVRADRATNPADRDRYRELGKHVVSEKNRVELAPGWLTDGGLGDDREAVEALRASLGEKAIVSVPGVNVDLRMKKTGAMISLQVRRMRDRAPLHTPWLHVVDVMIEYLFATSPEHHVHKIVGAPLSLTNLATGERHVRRLELIPDQFDDDGEPDETAAMATFGDLARGAYRLDVFPPADNSFDPRRPSGSEGGWRLKGSFERVLQNWGRGSTRHFASLGSLCRAARSISPRFSVNATTLQRPRPRSPRRLASAA